MLEIEQVVVVEQGRRERERDDDVVAVVDVGEMMTKTKWKDKKATQKREAKGGKLGAEEKAFLQVPPAIPRLVPATFPCVHV